MTLVTLKVIVFGLGSLSTPPLAVPPLSRTVNVKLASPAPLLLAAGVQVKFVRLAAVITWPAVTLTPDSFRVPLAGRELIVTSTKL